MDTVQKVQEVLAKPEVAVPTGIGGIGIAEAAEALAFAGSVFQSLGFIAGGSLSMYVAWNYYRINHKKKKK